MKVSKVSPITGKANVMDLPVTQAQLYEYAKGVKCIQDVFPNLNAEQREFIMTGNTKEDWDKMFPESALEDDFDNN